MSMIKDDKSSREKSGINNDTKNAIIILPTGSIIIEDERRIEDDHFRGTFFFEKVSRK
jgi:hypothetical protein